MKALIVVDIQRDFLPGGSLAIKDGDLIIPIINKLLPEFELVIFTKDWHPVDMKAFASNHKNKKPFDKYKVNGVEDTLWPDHCIQNTPGAGIHKDIKFEYVKKDFYIFKKGLTKEHHPYSGFDGTGLENFLKEKNVSQIFICGLATDYCVADTAIDGVNAGFDTIVIKDATKAIGEDLTNMYQEFLNLNIKIIDSWELPLFNIMPILK